MNIEQLQYVVALAKHQHFSKAAEEVYLSQSSLSKQINKLEKELCVKLFDRTTRTVQLTMAGQSFLRHAKQILYEIEAAQQDIQEYTGIERGKIVLGTIPVISYFGLTSLITAFHKMYPGIELKIKEAESKTLLNLRRSREIDIAIITQKEDADFFNSFVLYPLVNDELVLVTEKFHPLSTKGGTIKLAAAADERYIFMTPNSWSYNLCSTACNTAGFEPKIVHESSYLDTTAGLISAGLGVSLLSLRVASILSERYPLELIRLENPPKITIALGIPPELRTVRCIRAFEKFALEWTSIDSKPEK